ncbi:hypothetical protein COX09_04830 [Candidatus Beckwithbacteria bacterium CG23_combo_of_CG06-09_8_20_14_all_47_9]|uniref:LTD domain-containing protein n=2 Tax=Candidatus Beckwithiibacteriota TaxID=1752726 RepID=A0A2H0B2I7_9BACT|nr:MAG: hypothetical protein COX09_04830 [Candidatus Beckwithbacteria bacterium CG23_combo_of_CG06-09_8_20_14_all_47_9]
MKSAWLVFIGILLNFLFLFPVQPILAQVKINEFVVDADPEWVEFYNASDSADYLKTYWLDDDEKFDDDSGSSAKKNLTNLNINNLHYPYFELPLSIFNNTTADWVVIFDNTGYLIDKYQYTSSPGKNIAIGRNPDHEGGFFTLEELTQGRTNALPVKSPEPTLSPSASPSPSSTSSNQTTTPPSPTQNPSPSPTPQPSKIYRVKEITLLNLSPEPVLGTTSGQTDPDFSANRQVAIILITTGAGLLLAVTFIIVRSWRKK